MERVISYASTSQRTKNIIEADGFRVRGDGMIGDTGDDGREVKIISLASTTTGTKNIVEADGFRIKGGGMIGDTPKSRPKHPHVAKQRMRDDMTDSQKQGIVVWNSMVDFLVKNDLMEKK